MCRSKHLELRPYQKECLASIPDAGRFLVCLATGLGKCFAAGTPILMFDGRVKAVENIREGELVMGINSTPRRVSGLSRGREEMFTVTPAKGEPYTVNASHVLSLKITSMEADHRKRVIDNRGRAYTAGDICNISVRDYLVCSRTFRHVAKGWRSGVDFPRQDVTIPPYILGLWLGDGSSRTTEVTTMDPEVVSALEEYCRTNSMDINLAGTQNGGKALTYTITGKNYQWGGNQLRTCLKNYGVLGNKSIPREYLINGRQERLELLAGLLDTDGYLVDGNVFEIATVRKNMNDAILFLARSLGLAAYSKKKVVDGGVYYRIDISGNTHLIPTRVPRRKASTRRQKKDVTLTGIGIEAAGLGEYFGFELEGPDKLFLLGDFTVVHNTVTFSRVPRRGRMLILSHRDELVHQPRKYFECPFGVEQAGETSSGEEVVSASVQTLVRRLGKFRPDEFDVIITDEAHHAVAPSYRKIYEYFRPRLHLGFTATPNRDDEIGLSAIYDDIIFERDLKWGIENGYLSDIKCFRVDIGFDLSRVAVRLGDYAPAELDAAVNIASANRAIAEAFERYAEPPALIFCVSVGHAQALARAIPGAVSVVGGEDRTEKVRAFSEGKIPALTNCMVFTEGTDLPNVRTVIIARPTKNVSLYTQMAGRGTRLFPGKDHMTLIDCVGASDEADLCTAPSLLGYDIRNIHDKQLLQGDLLFDLPELISRFSDTPEAWIRNVEYVDLWARGRKYNTHGVNYFRMPDGRMILSYPRITIKPEDSLGRILWNGERVPTQRVFDEVYRLLCENCADKRNLWDLNRARRWGDMSATDKQKGIIRRYLPDLDMSRLTKLEAGQILMRCFAR